MWLKVDYHSGIPIYRQIIEFIKEAIMEGRLKPGDQLMSVRELARDINVNVNTVIKAYKELENEGLIVAHKGLGYFVTRNGEYLKSMIVDMLKRDMKELMEKFKKMNMSMEEVIEIMRKMWECDEDDGGKG
ncbi:MAG: GntR family transcriptional regulator [Thermotogae bacterium]|nr:GntR family transcriptional regulator [Thermotogota bacterium]